MRERLLKSSPWVMSAGVVATLLGLAWDAVLHRLDPDLAAREGVFAPSNPGHVLFGGGIALTALGVALMLAGQAVRAPGRRARMLALGGAGAVVALGVLSFGVAAWTGESAVSGGHRHTHDEAVSGTPETAAAGAQHTHDAPAAAAAVTTTSSKLPGVTHDHGEAIAITAADLEAAAKLVADVKAGTVRLEDFAVARSEGYIQITGGRNGLAHFHNQAYHTDGRFVDPERPEQLMYFRLPSGEMKLVGVMFLMPSGEAGPRIGGPLTAWHAHDNLCYSRTTGVIVALTNAQGQCPAGTVFRGVTPEMMHVWLIDNPGGVFGDDMEPAQILRSLGMAR